MRGVGKTLGKCCKRRSKRWLWGILHTTFLFGLVRAIIRNPCQPAMIRFSVVFFFPRSSDSVDWRHTCARKLWGSFGDCSAERRPDSMVSFSWETGREKSDQNAKQDLMLLEVTRNFLVLPTSSSKGLPTFALFQTLLVEFSQMDGSF